MAGPSTGVSFNFFIWIGLFFCCACVRLPKAMRGRGANSPQRLRRSLGAKSTAMLMRTPIRWARPKRHLPPGFIVPCQPILANKVPTGDGWLHELKHDGFRIIAYKDGDRVWLWSRNDRDWSAEFVAI